MCARSVLCSVLTLLSFVMTCPGLKQCSDCTDYLNCQAARDLVLNAPDIKERLLAAKCGSYHHQGLKFCCSELSTTKPSVTEPASTEPAATLRSGDIVEGHRNLYLLPENCGESDDTEKIIGGHVTGLYQYPWMVLLSFNRHGTFSFDCGGSLINDRYVLTAAHCLWEQPLAGVRAGEHDIEADPDCQGEPPQRICAPDHQDLVVEKKILHPDYPTVNKQRDIALLRLKKKVDLNRRNTRPICLPVSRELRNHVIVGRNLTVAGWGLTETGYKSSKLMAVDVPVENSESCLPLYNRRAQSTESYKICAGAKDLDSCNGDSGGPLMFKTYYKKAERIVEYGLVSTGPIECGTEQSAAYTDVAKHMEWILDNIEP